MGFCLIRYEGLRMSSFSPDFENVSESSSSIRIDTSLRSSQAKQGERDGLASDVEAFLAAGGQINYVENGVSADFGDSKIF